MEDPDIPLERNLYSHPLAGLFLERQFEKVLSGYGWEKVPNWECLSVKREKGLFLSVHVDDLKTGWQETEHQSDLEISHERRRFGALSRRKKKPNSFKRTLMTLFLS